MFSAVLMSRNLIWYGRRKTPTLSSMQRGFGSNQFFVRKSTMLKKFSVMILALLIGAVSVFAQDAQIRNLTAGQKYKIQGAVVTKDDDSTFILRDSTGNDTKVVISPESRSRGCRSNSRGCTAHVDAFRHPGHPRACFSVKKPRPAKPASSHE